MEAELRPGESQSFTAQGAQVAWAVQEGPAGGSIDGSGRYTAPAGAGAFHVVARDLADGTRVAVAAVTVEEPPAQTIAISISPQSARVPVRGGQQFSAAVQGPAGGVSWSVAEKAGGTVSANGLYTAPAAPGTFHVIAASVADPSQRSIAAVTVFQRAAISLAPQSVALLAGATQQFSAQVSGSADPAVVWSVTEANGGRITPGGLYTAPAAAGTFHVVGTARADAAVSAVATVAVAVPVEVTVSPSMVAVVPGQTVRFAARVSGLADERVTWSVEEAGAGSMGPDGAYTAPATPGAVHVTATSVADPARVGAALVIVQARTDTVAVSPADVLLGPGGALQFDAALTPALADRLVTWTVEEGAAGGTVSPTGFYVAPAAAGTFHVVARAEGDGTVSIATVRVDAQMISVSLSNPFLSSRLTDGRTTVSYKATVHGTADPSVTWSVAEGAAGGSVDANGLYEPPDHPGVFHVVATSRADPTRPGTATFVLEPGPGSGPDLVDRGGQVMPVARLYPVFWGAPADFPADAQAGIESLFKAAGASAVLAHLAQYFRGALASAPYAATLFDPSAPPASEPTGAEVAAAACRALDAAAQGPATDALYVVFSSNFPAGMHGCAWHIWSLCHDVPIVIAFVPDAGGDPGGCLTLGKGAPANVSAATAAMQSLALHEIVEAMTDPFPYQGWADPFSAEAADKCAGDLALTRMGSEVFLVQSVWSNADHRCAR
ncbi:MAG TPA: hypothetical protein VFL36_02885 [Myxococcales bacterium]|nr:hypothetical protein [Myxococcales bacterium]